MAPKRKPGKDAAAPAAQAKELRPPNNRSLGGKRKPENEPGKDDPAAPPKVQRTMALGGPLRSTICRDARGACRRPGGAQVWLWQGRYKCCA